MEFFKIKVHDDKTELISIEIFNCFLLGNGSTVNRIVNLIKISHEVYSWQSQSRYFLVLIVLQYTDELKRMLGKCHSIIIIQL